MVVMLPPLLIIIKPLHLALINFNLGLQIRNIIAFLPTDRVILDFLLGAWQKIILTIVMKW